MTIRDVVRPAVPMGIGTAAALVTLAVASRVLPGHVVLVHLEETGGSALAASRDDVTLLGLIVVVLLVGGYLVSAAALAWTPARHVLVPHARYWKTPAHRRGMRRRYATYLAVGVGGAQWFVAALFVLGMVSQSGALAVWWPPAALSVLFVLAILVGVIWVFTVGFTPPGATESMRSESVRAGSSRAVAPRAGAAQAATPVSTRASSAVRPTPVARTPSRTTATSKPGAKPPARPYQPRPRDGGSPRG
ncbi:hypothetical protein ACPEEZ_04630 [Frigoribacterium sp. 2-23]|uniref:hypothetical protein n=1 Tax=Frigoribacterium sp. 2-23 TaxID=3415006 RepID=UPI003C6EA7D6